MKKTGERTFTTVETEWWLFSPHGIAMPKGLYFTSVVFSFSFFCFSTYNLWNHWTDLNQTSTHIYLWLPFELPRVFTHTRAEGGGGQRPLFRTDLKLWPNIYLQLNMIPTIEKMPIYRDTLWSKHGWEQLARFCPPPKFSPWETASLTAWTFYNRQQANFGTCYVVARPYSLKQQNAGRAHAGLCLF